MNVAGKMAALYLPKHYKNPPLLQPVATNAFPLLND